MIIKKKKKERKHKIIEIYQFTRWEILRMCGRGPRQELGQVLVTFS